MEFRRVYEIEDIFRVLIYYNEEFVRPISERVGNLKDYSKKLCNNAYVYLLFEKGKEVGMLAYYANDSVNGKAFLTSVAIEKNSRGKGYGKLALEYMEQHCKDMGYKYVDLECDICNDIAMSFYKNLGYSNIINELEKSIILEKEI